jgi:glycosyltransferase involved in cell wall biosynthesis
MRLAILMSLGSPWARNTATHLSRLGHQVCAIDFADATPDTGYLNGSAWYQLESIAQLRQTLADVQVIHSRWNSHLRYLLGSQTVRRLCTQWRADLLLTLYAGGFAAAACLSGFRPYAIYAVGSDVLFVSGAKRWLTRLALERAARVFANGKFLAQKARDLAPAAQVVPHYLGVDTAKFLPAPKASAPLRILCSRGFQVVYNNSYLIQALSYLPASVPDYRLTFASGGPLLDSARRLADTLLSAEARSKVEFLGGVPEERLLQELQSAHVFVSVSRSDGTSTSLLEALSCGVYPVVSDIPQNREWIDPSLGQGILVPLDQPPVLAQVLAEAMRDPARRDQAAVLNRQTALDRADARKNTEALSSQLTTLLSRTAAPL